MDELLEMIFFGNSSARLIGFRFRSVRSGRNAPVLTVGVCTVDMTKA